MGDCTERCADWVIREPGRLGDVLLTDAIESAARRAGADAVGVTGVEPFAGALATLRHSATTGLSGPLGFTYNDPETATDLKKSFPWARSLVVFGVSYLKGGPASPAQTGPVVGRFATSDHYEPVRRVASVVSARLQQEGARAEVLIDDNRLVDRSAAVRAGVGWMGRSTMVLTPGHGPWMLLGSVVTDAPLKRSEPMRRDCGTCTACIPACPTGAIDDGTLDARRCLSTWLQTPGSIPLWVRPLLGRRIYGCDDCLTSCPPGHPAMKKAQPVAHQMSFTEMLAGDDQDLADRHHWWYVPRHDGRFIRRNLLVAAGNSGEPTVLPPIRQHLSHPSSMIRGHAAWALARALGPGSKSTLEAALESEKSPEGSDEIRLALLQTRNEEFYARLMTHDEEVTTSSELSALGVIGFDRWSTGDEEAVVVGEDAIMDVGPDRLAGIIRVNDPDRIIEKARREARSHRTAS